MNRRAFLTTTATAAACVAAPATASALVVHPRYNDTERDNGLFARFGAKFNEDGSLIGNWSIKNGIKQKQFWIALYESDDPYEDAEKARHDGVNAIALRWRADLEGDHPWLRENSDNFEHLLDLLKSHMEAFECGGPPQRIYMRPWHAEKVKRSLVMREAGQQPDSFPGERTPIT